MSQPTEVVSCPACKHLLRVPLDWLGQPVQCPQCQAQFRAPVRTADGLGEAELLRRPTPSTPPTPSRRLDPMLLLPAFGLMVLGITGLLVGGWYTTRYASDPAQAKQDVRQLIEESRKRGLGPPALADPAEQEQADNNQAEDMAPFLRVLIPLFTVVSGLVFYGGVAIALGRHYRMAQLGCILAMVNLPYGCCIPGLAVGAWGLLMLNSAEARAHFGK